MSKEATFSLDAVESWALTNNVEITGQESFGEPVVPNLMVLDKMQEVAQDAAEGEVIVQGITATRFRDPVLIGDTVEFQTDDLIDEENFTVLPFTIYVPERDSVTALGELTLTINGK